MFLYDADTTGDFLVKAGFATVLSSIGIWIISWAYRIFKDLL